MIKITHINVISEDDHFILYFQSDQGSCDIMVNRSVSLYIQDVLSHKVSVVGQLIQDADMGIEKCELWWNGKNILAKLHTPKRIYESLFQELLPLAIELGVPIFMDAGLLNNDYRFNMEHEKEVIHMISEAQIYWETAQVELLMDEIHHAIENERYEEAAVLRDQIQQLKNDIPKNNEHS